MLVVEDPVTMRFPGPPGASQEAPGAFDRKLRFKQVVPQSVWRKYGTCLLF